jgi:uncharacterized protein YciI
MPFMIVTFDKKDHKHVRDAHRAAHYAHLERYMPKLIASGGLRNDPDDEFIGGLIVLDTDSREEAQRFADTDPFTIAGLYERVKIVRWRPAFLGGQRIPVTHTASPQKT